MAAGQARSERQLAEMTAEESQRSDSRRAPRQGAQAIRRALSVMRILAAGREEGVHLSEVVRATGLTRPTVHRILCALIEESIVERSDRSGRYAIGRQVPNWHWRGNRARRC
jgi:uncharacterized membrane protein